MQRILTITTVLLFTFSVEIFAQETEPMRFYGAFQLWMRWSELNPGSAIGTEESDDAFDITLRRYRLGVTARPYKNISYTFGIGNNNLSRFRKSQSPRILDAYVNYHFSDKLIITGGKHGWSGTSRFAAPGTMSAMSFDINFAATPALEIHDDLIRKLGVAVRGQLDKLDYRIIFSKPFLFNPQPLSQQANFVVNPTEVNVAGYFKYQFLEKESLASAWHAWNYLGTKEIFNIGAGWTYLQDATQSLNLEGDTLSHPMRSFGVDVFYDRPLDDKHALTFYAVYLNHSIGPNFVRYIGANNPASGTTFPLPLNGQGNSFPENGTGDILFGYFGILKSFEKIGIQPSTTMQLAYFDALDDPMFLYEAAVNFILDGNKSKISVGYQSRPIFVEEAGSVNVQNRLAKLIFQYQWMF